VVKLAVDMSALQETFQCVADAISAVLGLDVEIVDQNLTVMAGTGVYRDRIGQSEVPGFLYTKVLQTGQAFIVEDPASDPEYDPSSRRGECCEKIEICCPILSGDRTYGVIGLVGFDEESCRMAVERKEQLLSFLRYMAMLLANKIEREEYVFQVLSLKNRVEAVIEMFPDGIITTDRQGTIDFCNAAAARILGCRREDVIGRPASRFLPGSAVATCLDAGESYQDREEHHELPGRSLHLVTTARPIKLDGQVVGAACSFRKISDVKRMLHRFSGGQVTTSFGDIVGRSPAIARVKERAALLAETDSTILILGETGTGKELLARAIHAASRRRHGPFVAINCGALPGSLLESELFGYEEGAFTGARKGGKLGRLELADGGTLFLDEIGDMPLHLQVKLLRVLQERVVERVGGTRPIPIDVRVISATNRDLEEMVRTNNFREDLYYRLNVIPLVVPPLRERTEDIPLLVQHFLARFSEKLGKRIAGIEPAALEVLMGYRWPGNVRELENAMEYAVSLEKGDVIHVESLPPRIRERCGARRDLRTMVREYEKQVIRETLARFEAREPVGEARRKAARQLNIGIATLYRKIREYGLEAGRGSYQYR
jgi:PAS domain S-box-containing protein